MSIGEKAREIFAVAGEPIVSTTASIVLSGIAGQIVPGVVSALMNYRQIRAEKNLERFMQVVKLKLDAYDRIIDNLDLERRKRVSDFCLPISLDYAAGSKQIEKISYIANGFINSSSDFTVYDDYIIMLYETMDKLTMLDLRILGVYDPNNQNDDSAMNIMQEFGIGHQEYDVIDKKLVREGLLTNLKDQDESDAIQELSEMFNGFNNYGHRRHTRIRLSDSYSLSEYGHKFICFFKDRTNS